jgi:hypothetical protein
VQPAAADANSLERIDYLSLLEALEMFGWLQALMPKEERFSTLFEKDARIVVAGAQALRRLLQGGDSMRRTFPVSLHTSRRFQLYCLVSGW